MSRLGPVLKQSLDSLGLRQRVTEQQAAGKWASVVGPQISAVSRVEKIADGVMFVSCKSSAWASELTLHSEAILRKLEKELGTKAIKEIRFASRGFRRVRENGPRDEDGAEIDLSSVELSDEDRRIAEIAASEAKSQELAEKIEKAVLAGKSREKALRNAGGVGEPSGAQGEME